MHAASRLPERLIRGMTVTAALGVAWFAAVPLAHAQEGAGALPAPPAEISAEPVRPSPPVGDEIAQIAQELSHFQPKTPAQAMAEAGLSVPPMPLGESTADHSKFKELQGPFASGPEVTQACLACHTEASHQFMDSIHWTWTYEQPETGQTLGKAHVMNAFCGNVASNETRCTSCHAGYGWEDIRHPVDMGPDRVDCLACHDTSGQYTKLDNQAGHPPLAPVAEGAKTITGEKAWAVDLAKAAQSVGDPTRENCGACHFYGGGGDNVKHGDLSSALVDPAPSVDVHMSKDGANMTCASCHVSHEHVFAGSRFDTDVVPEGHPDMPGAPRDGASCQSCHGEAPHEKTSVVGLKLNDHTDTVACQTCHIPTFAKGGVATKTWWDWSTAGKLKDGKPYHEDEFVQSDGKSLHTYLSTKGDFDWGENVVPSYQWFDGNVSYTMPDDVIDPQGVVPINTPHGEAGAEGARIFPFKVMHGKQAYDTDSNHLVFNNVYGPDGDTALWTNFDYEKSIAAGMAYMGLPYAGNFDFVETTMHWPITHMVAPADEALDCASCHSNDSRLAGIEGIYMPGSGATPGKLAGLALVALTLLGVGVHGLLRLLRRKKKEPHHG